VIHSTYFLQKFFESPNNTFHRDQKNFQAFFNYTIAHK
jgi:hypothetical protein